MHKEILHSESVSQQHRMKHQRLQNYKMLAE